MLRNNNNKSNNSNNITIKNKNIRRHSNNNDNTFLRHYYLLKKNHVHHCLSKNVNVLKINNSKSILSCKYILNVFCSLLYYDYLS